MTHTIVGLGNPGTRYAGTRHNVGRDALIAYREAHPDFSSWREGSAKKATISEGEIAGNRAALVLPETYMNISGASVRKFVYSLEGPSSLIVCHDDIDLPFGTVRVSLDRGAGGHHGVESIIEHLGGEGFARVRIGVSPTDSLGNLKKPREEEMEGFVLGRFRYEERELLPDILRRVGVAIDMIIAEGVEAAMNAMNGRSR